MRIIAYMQKGYRKLKAFAVSFNYVLISILSPPVTRLSPVGNSQNGEFEAGHTRRPPLFEVFGDISGGRGGFGGGIARAVKYIAADRNTDYFSACVKRQRIAVFVCRAA